MSQLTLFELDEPVKVLEETEETRCCKTCKVVQPIENYSPVSGMAYRHWICKSCKNAEARVRKVLRKENAAPSKDHKCPICLRGEEELTHMGGDRTPWSLDHDWVSKKFRGWLCHTCNRALGNLNDDKDALRRAIEYLDG